MVAPFFMGSFKAPWRCLFLHDSGDLHNIRLAHCFMDAVPSLKERPRDKQLTTGPIRLVVCNNSRMNSIVDRFRSIFHANRAARLFAPLVLIGAMDLLPAQTSFAKGAATTRLSIITGSIEECGAGPSNAVVRTFVVTLHERPSDRVIAIYSIRPSAATGYYAFRVAPGIYYLTTNAKTSPPPRGNIKILPTSAGVTEIAITTTCQ